MISDKYFDIISDIMNSVKYTQRDNIMSAAKIVADSIINGGILQSFGSGHSYSGAIEVAGRAGTLIPAKVIEDPAGGRYEIVEGVGTELMKSIYTEEHDCFILISNSGRNPLQIEMAQEIKNRGNKLIVVTCLESSKKLVSKHSSGKNLYEFADVILDNNGVDGDTAIEIENVPTKVGPTSTITTSLLLNCVMIEAVNMMKDRGYIPPIYLSANIDGGREHNQELIKKYAHRVHRK